MVVQSIEAILFDMNGTLRVREPHEPTRRAATTRMLELLGMDVAPDAYWGELTLRHKAYSHWAQENLVQLPEKEIWTRWMVPEIPDWKIERHAAELSLAWRDLKGRTIPRSGAEETLVELKRRGYRLGVISNSMSSLDIPRSLKTFGWQDLFEVVILSATVKYRKPAPDIFWEATRALNLDPSQCAYLGNRKTKDVLGCRRAGFTLAIMLETPGEPRADEQDPAIQPDRVIRSLSELLDIFPPRIPLVT